MKRLILLCTLTTLLFTSVSYGSNVIEIKWESLVPKLPPQENPMANLSEEEVGLIEWVIYLRQYLPKEETPENKEFYEEMNNAIPVFKEKGIDIDKIIADRRFRNSSVNSELDGKVVRLSGYLLPLDLSGKAVTDFLLVPWVGACIHSPPPPPNQMIHAVSNTPRPYEIDTLFLPVVVTGKLHAKSLSKELFFVDGTSNVDIGYTMSVSNIEEYKQ